MVEAIGLTIFKGQGVGVDWQRSEGSLFSGGGGRCFRDLLSATIFESNFRGGCYFRNFTAIQLATRDTNMTLLH